MIAEPNGQENKDLFGIYLALHLGTTLAYSFAQAPLIDTKEGDNLSGHDNISRSLFMFIEKSKALA